LGSGSFGQTAPALEREAVPWERVTEPLALRRPRDYGSHPAYQTEWWYATGDLLDGSGKRFGYQLTIFRRGLDASPPRPGESLLRPRQVFAANLAIVDVAAARLTRADRVRRGAAGLAGASETDLSAWVEDWRIERGGDGTIHLHAGDVERRIAIDLDLAPGKALVLHGEDGLSQKGGEPGNASMYTSWTRRPTFGTIQVGRADKPLQPGFAVTGESWFDHEFGSSQLGPDIAGWDWLGLRFSDGRELMLYRLRGPLDAKRAASGPSLATSAGTLVERDGSTRALRASDFTLDPLYHWMSTLTRGRYPVAWRVSVPGVGIACEVTARVNACEIDARESVGTIYWEGPVAVTGTVEGSGYLELTGYVESMAGRF
jgi:predicted secreted hydrolase